ncbi:MAG: RTX toxin, partial [Verrucomicrobia bacterium]|nr:RTX toxin [Verrucomicrobiota bacterium]
MSLLLVCMFVAAPRLSAAPAATGGNLWTAQGGSPTHNGQVEGIANGEVGVAIQAVAAHPTNPNILYAGAVNGGIWTTTNAATPLFSPVWTPQTDFASSLSISSLEFDPTDASHNTLVAGVGRFSSLGSDGGSLIGILRTVNGGKSWAELNGGGILTGVNISGVAPRGNVIVVSADRGSRRGIFRSTDSGASFVQISSGTGTLNGLPSGVARTLAGDPRTNTVLYTGVYRTPAGGTNGI